MIVPKLELQSILKGKEGAATVDKDPPAEGDVLWLRESRRSLPACRGVVTSVRWCKTGEYEVLLEKLKDDFDLPARGPSERPRLRLTRRQRQRLFAGESPKIGGSGQAPVKKGDEVRLSPLLVIRVLRVDPEKGGGWSLHYELVDSRDRPRLLRRTPPAHAAGEEYEHMLDPDAQELAQREAAEDSAYTSRQAGLVAEAGEAPSREWVDMRHKTVREFDHQRRLARHAEKMREQGRERSKARRKRAA